jgi:hypothetical protein
MRDAECHVCPLPTNANPAKRFKSFPSLLAASTIAVLTVTICPVVQIDPSRISRLLATECFQVVNAIAVVAGKSLVYEAKDRWMDRGLQRAGARLSQ